MNRRLLGFAGAGLVLAASTADATLYVGLQQDAGPITTVASDPSGFVVWGGSFGQFEAVAVTASGQPVSAFPNILQTTALQVNNSGPANAGTLTIYVTSTDNAPLGSVPFESGFTTVSLLNH